MPVVVGDEEAVDGGFDAVEVFDTGLPEKVGFEKKRGGAADVEISSGLRYTLGLDGRC